MIVKIRNRKPDIENSITMAQSLNEINSRHVSLVFDTETSGLWPRDSNMAIEEYPYIVQMSFILYDNEKNKILRSYNSYIKQTENIDFNSPAFKITKITKEMCDNGVHITEALQEFYLCYMISGNIVAHNIEFDKKMIQLEILRHYNTLCKQIEGPHILFNEAFNDVFNIKTCCTMYMGKNITNIMMTGKDGHQWKKNPKLSELYEKLFNKKAENLHDSMVDTKICLQCFIKIRYNKIISIE